MSVQRRRVPASGKRERRRNSVARYCARVGEVRGGGGRPLVRAVQLVTRETAAGGTAAADPGAGAESER